jgi:phenylalanine-4-hydroxylase
MHPNYDSNPVIEKLPSHLRQFIMPQNYENYSAIDQAVWRYVMRKNVDYLSRVAHESYIEGLKKAGLSIDCIPNMYGMNRILKEIGWAAVAVDGFIPPSAFMEFQAYNVLVIASDIRQLEHIEYTPAPDIIHEGAGHAPIIANPEYAEYLRRFGEIGCKAIPSAKDYELYEAVRHLSIIKEAPGTPLKKIESAESKVEWLQNNMGDPSEMALIRNLHWWTVEYGLIGTINNPRIYGAGLLSSIGESSWCMTHKVKKLPYSIAAAYQSFDITRPQPQLYVTPDFAHLSLILEEFTDSMALRKGGLTGLQKLIDSKETGTIELSTGLQVSGNFSNVIAHEGKPVYFRTKGKTALANRDRELVGHGTNNYEEGFGSPVGRLKGIHLAIEDMSPRDLKAYHIYEGKTADLEFEGGITVKGDVITGKRNLQGKIILIRFKNCMVKHNNKILFRPDWGLYDMAVGKEIISAYNGPADVGSFNLITHIPGEKTIKIKKTKERLKLEDLYKQVREYREEKNKSVELKSIFSCLQDNHPNDWLLALELYEISRDDIMFNEQIIKYLNEKKTSKPEVKHLIENGIELIHSLNYQDYSL